MPFQENRTNWEKLKSYTFSADLNLIKCLDHLYRTEKTSDNPNQLVFEAAYPSRLSLHLSPNMQRYNKC